MTSSSSAPFRQMLYFPARNLVSILTEQAPSQSITGPSRHRSVTESCSCSRPYAEPLHANQKKTDHSPDRSTCPVGRRSPPPRRGGTARTEARSSPQSGADKRDRPPAPAMDWLPRIESADLMTRFASAGGLFHAISTTTTSSSSPPFRAASTLICQPRVARFDVAMRPHKITFGEIARWARAAS